MKKSDQKQVKTIMLSIAIALVTVFFFVYAIESFYSQPEYEDYCGEMRPVKLINNSAECEDAGGYWNSYGPKDGYCEQDYYCRQDYNSAKEVYERNVFLVNLFLGLAVLLTGFFLDLKAIGSGLMASGVIMIIYGTLRYWSDLSNMLRTFVLGLTLVILIALAYKKLDNSKN